MRFGFLLVVLLLGASRASAQTDEADAAWRAGDTGRAEQLYEARLASNPDDVLALHRLALMRGWKNRFDDSIALFDRLLRVDPTNTTARVDRARVMAWRGQPERAMAVIDSVLVTTPDFLPALQARAQFASWAGRFGEALLTYDRILAVAPEVNTTQYDRARVLAWAARTDEAESAYERMLERDPKDVQALLGLATIRSWAGDTRAGEQLYQRVLAIDARNLDALRGRARAATYDGKLPLGEARWHEALAVAPSDAEALAGLAQTLRWQGRDAAALEYIRRALTSNPADATAREQLREVDVAMQPRIAPTLTYERDSDGNRITSFNAGAAYRPQPRLELRVDGYLRDAQQVTGVEASQNAFGGAVTLWTQVEPGWSIAGTLGASSSNIDDAKVTPTYGLTVATPARYTTVATLSARRSAVDATALLVQRQVTSDELSATAARTLPWLVRLRVNASVARFEGAVSGEGNTRTAGGLSLSRRVHPAVTIIAQARTFAFERNDISDGYFSPLFYGIAELSAQWQRERGAWGYNVEVAPGLQRIGRDGDVAGTARGAAGFSWSARPGQSIGVTLNLANAGLASLSPTTAGGYRYAALSLTSRWGF